MDDLQDPLARPRRELTSDDWVLRDRAVHTLGDSGDPQAVRYLVGAMSDAYSSVRIGAAAALGKLGDSSAIETLVRALEDSDERVRLQAACSLSKLGDMRALKPLLAVFFDQDPRGESLGLAGEGLACLGDHRAVPPLVGALHSENGDIRLNAVIALGMLGDARAVGAVLEVALNEQEHELVRLSAIEALSHLADPRAVPPLRRLLMAPNRELRLVAGQTIMRLEQLENPRPEIGRSESDRPGER